MTDTTETCSACGVRLWYLPMASPVDGKLCITSFEDERGMRQHDSVTCLLRFRLAQRDAQLAAANVIIERVKKLAVNPGRASVGDLQEALIIIHSLCDAHATALAAKENR